jgi:hypothetical protein
MPPLKQLLEELRKIDVDPDEIRISAALYDDLFDEAEDIADESPDDAERNQQTRSSYSIRDKDHMGHPNKKGKPNDR